MTTHPLSPSPDSIYAQILAKRMNRPRVDANGNPFDPDAPRTRYEYDANGRLIAIKTETASNEDT